MVCFLAISWPALLTPFNRLWLKLGLALNKIVNPVVMTAVFVSTIVPGGVLMRLGGKDTLRLRRRPDAATYWSAREPSAPATETMQKQF
jgi:hypothetical protein